MNFYLSIFFVGTALCFQPLKASYYPSTKELEMFLWYRKTLTTLERITQRSQPLALLQIDDAELEKKLRESCEELACLKDELAEEALIARNAQNIARLKELYQRAELAYNGIFVEPPTRGPKTVTHARRHVVYTRPSCRS